MTCTAICLIIRYNFSVTSVAVREDSGYTSHRPTAVSSQKHLFRLIIYLVFRPARESRAFFNGTDGSKAYAFCGSTPLRLTRFVN